MNTKENKQKTVTFTFRMNADLHKTLKERSSKNKRSIAKEIEYMLDQYILTDKTNK